MAKAHKKTVDTGKLGLLERPLASGALEDKFNINDYLTFKNIVIAICALTFLVFLGNAISVQIAVLATALMGLLWLILLEMSARHKWEHALLDQLRHMNDDYERLVREVARVRNDNGALRKKLSEAGGSFLRSYSGTSGEPVEARMIRSIAEQLSKLGDVSREDQQFIEELEIDFDTAALEKEASTSSDESEIGQRLSDDQVVKLVHAAVKKDRINLFLQPIVNLPQRKLRFYETFSRIHITPKVFLPARRYVDLARGQDLLPHVDNLLLLRGLQAVRSSAEGDYSRAFFFNITSLTLNDPKFMGDLVEFISQNRTLAPQLIFEMGQKDLATMSPDTIPTLEGLSKLGCRFSMDSVKDLNFDLNYLEAHHIRFVKISAVLMLRVLREEGGLQKLKRIKADLDRTGIDVIVERIETDRQLLDLLDIEIDYGQGYLFGRPTLYDKIQ